MLGAMLVGFCLRMYKLGEIPSGLWMDEGLMGQGVLGILDGTSRPILFFNGGLPEEPLSYYLSALSVFFFGQNTFAMRLPNALFGTLTIPLVWGCARAYVGPRAAVIAALYFATFRWHVHFSRLGFRTLLAPFFTLLIFWSLGLFWNRRRTLWAALGGIFLGGSLYTYTGMRPVVLGVLAWFAVIAVVDLVQSKRASREQTPDQNDPYLPIKGVLVSLFFAVLVAAPLGIHFLKNPTHFSSRQNDVTLFREKGFQWELFGRHARDVALMGILRGDDEIKHNLPGSPNFGQAYLWSTHAETEFAQWNALKETELLPDGAFTPEGRFDPNGYGHPVFDLVTGILFYLGLVVVAVRAFKGCALSWGLLMWLCAGSANSVFSQGAPNQLRMLMVAPLACIAVGQGLDFLMSNIPLWKSRGRDLAVLVVLWGWFSAGETHRYFNEWARHPDVGRAFNFDFTEVARWLQENGSEQELILGPEFFVNFTSVDFLTRGVVPIKSDSSFLAETNDTQELETGTWLLVTNPAIYPPLQVSIPEKTKLIPVHAFSHEGQFIWLTVYEVGKKGS